MSISATVLDPQVFRTKVLKKKPTSKRKDGGFSLIEIMAGMAIIAILALAILPQFSKFFERAAVQNMSAEISNAALLIESDYSLTGKTTYELGNVTSSMGDSKKSEDTKWDAARLLSADGAVVTGVGHGFRISATNPGITHYTITYDSTGPNPGLKIGPKTASPTP